MILLNRLDRLSIEQRVRLKWLKDKAEQGDIIPEEDQELDFYMQFLKGFRDNAPRVAGKPMDIRPDWAKPSAFQPQPTSNFGVPRSRPEGLGIPTMPRPRPDNLQETFVTPRPRPESLAFTRPRPRPEKYKAAPLAPDNIVFDTEYPIRPRPRPQPQPPAFADTMGGLRLENPSPLTRDQKVLLIDRQAQKKSGIFKEPHL